MIIKLPIHILLTVIVLACLCFCSASPQYAECMTYEEAYHSEITVYGSMLQDDEEGLLSYCPECNKKLSEFWYFLFRKDDVVKLIGEHYPKLNFKLVYEVKDIWVIKSESEGSGAINNDNTEIKKLYHRCDIIGKAE